VAQLQEMLRSGRTTATLVAQAYLRRIEAIDRRGPQLRSVIEVNPEALALAKALDDEHRAKGPRGPLHGIPCC
jgi:amidase